MCFCFLETLARISELIDLANVCITVTNPKQQFLCFSLYILKFFNHQWKLARNFVSHCEPKTGFCCSSLLRCCMLYQCLHLIGRCHDMRFQCCDLASTQYYYWSFLVFGVSRFLSLVPNRPWNTVAIRPEKGTERLNRYNSF